MVLHGLFGSADNWHSMCQRLGQNYRVFAVDLRNHGDSPHSEEMTYTSMAADVLEFALTHGLQVPHVLGHSMGGKVAMQFAATHPEQARSLVSVDMGPGAYGPRHRQILEAMQGLDLRRFTTRKQMEDALAQGVPELATRRFLLKNVRRHEHGFFWRLGLSEIAKAYPLLNAPVKGERRYPGPALFVRGEHSDYLNEADLAGIRQIFPQAQLISIAGATHLVHVDRPDHLYQVITRFLQSTA